MNCETKNPERDDLAVYNAAVRERTRRRLGAGIYVVASTRNQRRRRRIKIAAAAIMAAILVAACIAACTVWTARDTSDTLQASPSVIDPLDVAG